MITGMRGLCNGLGPAVFGLIFYLFHVDLNEELAVVSKEKHHGGGANQTVRPTTTLDDNVRPTESMKFNCKLTPNCILILVGFTAYPWTTIPLWISHGSARRGCSPIYPREEN